MSQAGWDAVWDRFNDEIHRIAAAGQQCNPDLFYLCERFKSPNFLFRGYAAFSLTPDHEEDLVFSLDCWRDDATVRLFTDIARHGSQILAKIEDEVETEWDGPDGNRELGVATDEAVAFFAGHLDLILDELCPDRRR
jgi:hypothetical protein